MKLSDFFFLHKSDRQVLIGFLLVALMAMGGLLLTGTMEPDEAAVAPDSTATDKRLASKTATSSSTIIFNAGESSTKKAERFPFDPNTVDSVQLLRLGLKPWQVRNIYKYRASGGIYRTKEDFAQLYGLTLKEYRELEPYIRISDDYQPAAKFIRSERARRDTLLYPKKIAEGETIDLTTADTSQLRRVPGIGVYYAHEIVKYRKRLGGFSHVDQLDEIDNFPEASKKYFSISRQPMLRLNLNKLTLNELKQHPYIQYYQARAIVDYRRQKRKLQSLDDLRFLHEFSEDDIRRLAPYVEF
jgi:DNA uptake protein ComE-like DNA-binding protein